MTTSIPAPKNFQLPEGVREGDQFKLLATVRLVGKRLQVLALGDEEPDSDDETMAQAVIRARRGQQEDTGDE